jgi:uncharacterized protein (DUF305 family)
MENKNTTMILGLGFLVLGFLGGYYFSSMNIGSMERGMHSMSGGTMMKNEHMNMDDMMQQMNQELLGKTGDDFDKAFLAEMIVHHEGAVQMAELALTNAKREEIKELSKAIIDAQKVEITQMNDWSKAWFK